MTCYDLYPNANPNDPATVAKMRQWLIQNRSDLEDYKRNKGQPGYYFGRGFVGDTNRTIKRLERWLVLIGK